MPKVFIADPIHEAGMALLRAQKDLEVEVRPRLSAQELADCISGYDALIVRSETQVTAEILEAAYALQVVGRAGVGVDNIDLETATRLGVAVVNAPTGNTLAAAEHTIALIMALARSVPQADASLKRGEWRRSDFIGVEIRGKSLGIIGLGRVGSAVAQRARGLEMLLLAYDPFLAPERAAHLGVELVPMERLLAESDFLTLHTPLTDSTRSILGAEELAKLKPGARLVNVARGGLIDEEALVQALDSGHIAGAALDVFDQEPPTKTALVTHPLAVTTPHLGASTVEAQAEVAREVVEQVLAVLHGQPAQFTVNAPFVSPEVHELVAPYLQVAADVGAIAIQLIEGQLSSITLRFQGEIAQNDTQGLKAAALMGLLRPISDERVNLVNAVLMAEQRGMRVQEERGDAPEQYTNLVTVDIATTEGSVRVAGIHLRGRTHIVRIRDNWMDAVVESPCLLVVENNDSPGLIGAVGSIAGEYDINISSMNVGRLEPRGRATMLVGLDEPMPEEAQARIRAVPRILGVRLVRL